MGKILRDSSQFQFAFLLWRRKIDEFTFVRSTWWIYIGIESFFKGTKWIISLNYRWIFLIPFFLFQDQTRSIEWQWFAQTLNPYYEHDSSTSAMLINDDRLIFQTIDQNRWDFGSDDTGNLLNENNLDHYIKRFQQMNIDFVSCNRLVTFCFQWDFSLGNDRLIIRILKSLLMNIFVSLANFSKTTTDSTVNYKDEFFRRLVP